MHHGREQFHMQRWMTEPLLKPMLLRVGPLGMHARVGDLFHCGSEEVVGVAEGAFDVHLEDEESDERWERRYPFEGTKA